MKITNETFMEILGLVEWDDRILDLLEYLEIDRPTITGEEFGCECISEKYGITFYFSINIESGTKYQREKDGTLCLSQIAWKLDTTLPMVFDITYTDSSETIIKKVGRPSDIPENFHDTCCGWGDYEKPYWLTCCFTDESMKQLENVFIRLQQPYDFNKKW